MKKNQCCECGEIIGINEDPDNWGLCASCQEWYSEDGPLANLDDSSELEWYANFLVGLFSDYGFRLWIFYAIFKSDSNHG